MAFKDMLLPLTSYPAPTDEASIEDVLGLAEHLGTEVMGVTFEMDLELPIGLYADPLRVRATLASEKKKCSLNARDLLNRFEAIAGRLGVRHERRLELCMPAGLPARIAGFARLHDVTVLPLKDGDGFQRRIAEQLVFESGRPILVLPEQHSRKLPQALHRIGVAWDCSGPATRAVADALPLLQRAKSVRIFTVVGDKALDQSGSGSELSRHLARHGVDIILDEVKSQKRPIGEVFEAYVVANDIDLLVMGAYSHARLREILLGGATKSILARPPCWVLMSR
jgi:nucleotide-binding universal stress UspA family protein